MREFIKNIDFLGKQYVNITIILCVLSMTIPIDIRN